MAGLTPGRRTVYDGVPGESVLSTSVAAGITPASPNCSMTTCSEPVGLPVGSTGRLVLTAVGACLLGGFLLAAQLEPDPRGYGTHQRLGLPECSFRTLFNRPCPGCGLTTSMAHFVRGQWLASVRANPAGLLMALVCVVLIPWCGISAWHGRMWWVDDPWPVLAWLMGGWGAIGLAVWIVRWIS